MKPNPNTEVPIHITPHHLSLTPALSQFVQDKIAKLPRFAGDAVAADIVLRRHHGTAEGKTFSASARLALPGHDVHATATHADLYAAITSLTKKLARRSLKRKARRSRATKRLRRSSRGNRPAVLRDALVRWSEASTKVDLLDAFLLDACIPAPEADAPSRKQIPRNTAPMVNGLVERSSSSNPAHGISPGYLECLAGYPLTITFNKATQTKKTAMKKRNIIITVADHARLSDMIAFGRLSKAERDEARALKDELERAELVATDTVPPDVITMNSRAELLDLDTNERMEFTVVFPEEANLDEGKISVLAPVGTGMLGYRVGDTFEQRTPYGVRRLVVLAVTFQPEAALDAIAT